MGGVVDAVGDVVGGVGGVVSGVANQIPVIGPYVGPVVGGMTGGPLGFATSLAGNALQGSYGGGGGGGGGSSTPTYAQPTINYGNNTYSYGGNKVDASPYFITGDKGVYNLLPALGQINAGTNRGQYTPRGNNPRAFNRIGAQGAYTPYEAYQDIQAQMANDPTALAAFNKAYSPTTFNAPGNAPNFQLFGRNLPIGAPNPNSPLSQFYANNPNPYGQYVNYGLSKKIPNPNNMPDTTSFNTLAQYAVENKNPFFLPFQTTQGATPLGFTPSASALAPIDTTNYLSGFNTANTAQQQAARDAQAAQEAQRQAQQQAQRNARIDQRDARRDQGFGQPQVQQPQVQQPQPTNSQQRGLGALQTDKFRNRLG